MVLLADPEKLRDHHADSVLFIKTGPMIEVLERFKVMLVRKRGPRKGSASWPRKPKCEPPELVAQGAA
jgi:hypothetical protein